MRVLPVLVLAILATAALPAPADATHMSSCEDLELPEACVADCAWDSTAYLGWKEWVLWVRRHCLP